MASACVPNEHSTKIYPIFRYFKIFVVIIVKFVYNGLVYSVQEVDFTVTDKTMTFKLGDDHEDFMRETLTQVFDALKEKGYNPINQIVGYILSEDPTYITTHNNARSLIRRIDRDELLAEMVKSYLNT